MRAAAFFDLDRTLLRRASGPALSAAMRETVAAEPAARLEYVAVVDFETLEPVETTGPNTLAALAVRIGSTRLIDNLLITADGEPVL